MKPARFVTRKCRTLLISAVSSTFVPAGQFDAMQISTSTSTSATVAEYPTSAYTFTPDATSKSFNSLRPSTYSAIPIPNDNDEKPIVQPVRRRSSMAAILSTVFSTRRRSLVSKRTPSRRINYVVMCICSLIVLTYYAAKSIQPSHLRSYSPELDLYRQKGFLNFDVKDPFSMQWVPLQPLRKLDTPVGLLKRSRTSQTPQDQDADEKLKVLSRRSTKSLDGASPAPQSAAIDWVRLIQLAGNLSYPNLEFGNLIDYGWLLNNGIPRNTNAKYPLLEYPSEEQPAIQEAAMRATSYLHNSSILVLGDSVDRNSVQQHAWTFQQNVSVGQYPGLNLTEKMFNDKNRGMPHQFTIRNNGLNLTMANGFYYGVADDTENFGRIAPDWYGPGDAVERVRSYFKPLADSLEFPVKLISLHSGMWDMALWGVRDKEAGQSTETPLSEERVVHWMLRMHRTIAAVKECFPGVPIVYRKIHRVGPSRGSEDWGGHSGKTVTNYFTDVRFAQLQAMQERVAHEAGLALLDFGMLFEGWQQYQDKVHPQQWPGGLILAQALLHNSYLAATTKDFNML